MYILKLMTPEKIELRPIERMIVSLISQGFGTKQIASKLMLTDNTVKVYISTIYKKTGLQTKGESRRVKLADLYRSGALG